jgi:hypothetical protein
VYRSRTRANECNFVSLGLDPQAEPDPAKTPLITSPKGEGGASPFQTPNALHEEHIMNRTLSAAIIGVILAAFGVLSAHAQDLKAMLLKPTNGWVIDWDSPSVRGSGMRDSGASEVVFEERGGKVVAKLYITSELAYKADLPNCERDVAITADTISLDGCRDQNVVLILDPNDKVYPLKTKTKTVNGYDWKLKEK